MCYNRNCILISGVVIKAPEKRVSQDGALTVTRFYFESSNGSSSSKMTLLCKSYNRLAEKVESIPVGASVLIRGRLKTSLYKDNNGKQQKLVEIVATDVWPAMADVHINIFEIAGRTTQDGQFFVGTGDKKALMRTSFAVSRKVGSEDEVEFVNVTAFDKKAEFMSKWAKKGTPFYAYGKLSIEQYTRNDGSNGTSYTLVADDVGFTSDKKSSNSNSAPVSAGSNAVSPTADGFVPGNSGSSTNWWDNVPMH